MDANQFLLPRGKRASITFDFSKAGGFETDIDILYSGTYINTPDIRMLKRIDFRNSDHSHAPFETGVNNTLAPVFYDLVAGFKNLRSENEKWNDFTRCTRTVQTGYSFSLVFTTTAIHPEKDFSSMISLIVNVDIA